MTVKPKYYFNLDGNISDGEKEYSLENIEDKIGGLSIGSDLKDNYMLYGRNSLLDLLNNFNDENEQLKYHLEICKDAKQAYKQDWKACVSYCDTYKDELYTLKDNIQGLIEENEQLKKEVFDWKTSAEEYFKIGKSLKKENKQLKKENNELKLMIQQDEFAKEGGFK